MNQIQQKLQVWKEACTLPCFIKFVRQYSVCHTVYSIFVTSVALLFKWSGADISEKYLLFLLGNNVFTIISYFVVERLNLTYQPHESSEYEMV